MESFTPLINLLVLMSTLSIAAERLANAIKLRDPWLSEKRARARDEKEREREIARRALAVSILLAVLVKADFFAILSHLDAPWDTLGWVAPTETPWQATKVLQAMGGTVVTGLSLGFGSKFWHEVLDVVSSVRNNVRNAHVPHS